MSVKNKLLQEINKKAQKIREKRVDAANNKTLEVAVFDFFKNIEESKRMGGGVHYDPVMFMQAKYSLEGRLKGFDRGAKVSIEYNVPEDTASWEQQDVRGVTIWWSDKYIAANSVDPSLYIDIGQMLFI